MRYPPPVRPPDPGRSAGRAFPAGWRHDDISASQNGIVTIVLPRAEVFVATLDNHKSYIYGRETGVIGMNPTLETDARRAAQQEILNAAVQDGILDKAQANAEDTVRRLVLGLGSGRVRSDRVFRNPPEPSATPAS